jgi:tetratricopeptide (TPR) repeat protein
MMIRFPQAILIIALFAQASSGQSTTAVNQQNPVDARQSAAQITSRQLLLHQIAIYEEAAQRAEALHADRKTLANIYAGLGDLYMDGRMFLKSEDAMRRAILLLKDGPQNKLADEISRLSMLHSAMGMLKEAEKDQKRELAVREAVGDPMGIALAWNDMAALNYAQRKFKNASEYAQKAYAVLADEPSVPVEARIAVRQALAFSLSGMHSYQQAIPLLKDAFALAEGAYGEDSSHTGVEAFMLGYIYWKSGDTRNAALYMTRGIAKMKADLGWGQAIYVNAMGYYARFLRENGQTEQAASAERELSRFQDVIDARSFTGMSSAFLPPAQP